MKINYGKLMLQQAQAFKDKLAVVNIERNRTFTFEELHLLTNKISHMMKNQFNLGRGDVYGCLLENDNLSMFSQWMWKSDTSAVWFNYRDSLSEHLYQIDFVKPKIVFLENEIIEKDNYYRELRARNIDIIVMDKIDEAREGVHYFWDLLADEDDSELNIEHDIDEHIVLYRFTGGTTGQGKCAMYTIQNKLTAASQSNSHHDNYFDNNTKYLHVTPLSHGTALFVLPVYFKGGTNYTINVPDLEYMAASIEKYRITSNFMVPTLFYRLLDLGLEEKYDLSSIDSMFYGAAPMSPSKVEELQAKLGNVFVQVYGSTEAWPLVMVLGKEEHIIKTEADRQRLASTGRPLTGVEMGIYSEDGQELAPNEIGEIWIRSKSVIKGYYNSPEETAANFSDGFWRSGDMGYVNDEGYYYIVDRKKDMIITGGFNVYAIEVENGINSHPSVQQSAVVGIPHDEWGEAVHAEVVINDGVEITEEELMEFSSQRLGKYKGPKSIKFVDELPMTSVGKVLRREVRDRYWSNQSKNVN